ncbi:MAG TPA: PDZ domain-containing protein [Candidatus Omnitrophota bacterium]|nr:PDZ domain-containing protein [Candidatus Omnitrophota bacterium]
MALFARFDSDNMYHISSNAVFSILCLITVNFPFNTSFADTVYTNDDNTINGVVLEKTAKNILLATSEKNITIDWSQIKSIAYTTEKQNLIMLADFAKNKKDFSKAFYLYKKIFMLDPTSQEAIDGLAEVDKYLFTNNPTAEKTDNIGIVKNYERIRDKMPDGINDDQVLSKDTELSQKMIDVFGIVFTSKSQKTSPVMKQIIWQVIPASRADNAGLKNSDVLIMVGDSYVSYMGIYDISCIILKKSGAAIDLVVSREVNIWINNENSLSRPSLYDAAGFSLEQNNSGLFVSKVESSSDLSNYGIDTGDELTQINDTPVNDMTITAAADLITKPSSNKIKLTFQKNIRL